MSDSGKRNLYAILPDGSVKKRFTHRLYSHAVAIKRDDEDWCAPSFSGSYEGAVKLGAPFVKRGIAVEIVAVTDVNPAKAVVATPKPAKQNLAGLPAHELRALLISKPTLADKAWTSEPRLKGEKRLAFINRVLFDVVPSAGI